MSKIVQWKRGNTAVNSTYVGAEGEITIDTEIWTAYVHDGITPGGHAFSAGEIGNITVSGANGQTFTGTVANADIVFAPNGSGVLRSNSSITAPNITLTGFANVGGNLNVTGDTVITGNLRVDGLTETINSTTVTINDKNIVLGNNVSTSANVDGGGIDLGSPTVAYWRYTDTSRGWVTGNNISTGGNITAAGNATVSFLTVNNSLTVQSTITTAANLTASYLFGNGSQLTGLASTYSNTNVFSYMGSNSNVAVTTTGNITTNNYFLGNGRNLTGVSNLTNGSYTVQLSSVGLVTLPNGASITSAIVGNTANVKISANNQGYIFISNDGKLGVNQTNPYFTVGVTGNVGAYNFYALSDVSGGYQFSSNAQTGLFHDSTTTYSSLKLVHDGQQVITAYANSNVQISGNIGISSIGSFPTNFANAFISATSNANSYSQFIAQNVNNGTSASTDFVATADNGTDSTYYVDLGINSSNANISSFFGDTTSKDDGYLYIVGYNAAGPSTGNIGNLILGSTNGVVKTFIGNTAQANVITTVSSSGFTVNGNITASAMTVNNSVTIGTTLGVTGNLNVGNVITTGTLYGNAAAGATGTISNAVGYMGMPQNSQSTGYTLALIDQGKHIYLTANSNITIPANSSVSFPIGSAISVVNGPNVQSNVIITTDTLYLAANGATGTRSISTYGMFTLVKVTNTVWYINGSGIT